MRTVLLLLMLLLFPIASALAQSSRGYVTTAEELRVIKEKANQGRQPYLAAARSLLEYAGEPLESFHPPDITCERQDEYYRNSYRLLARAMAYHLTGNAKYAAEAIAGLKNATAKPASRRPEKKGDQCNLNAAWYIPAIIQAADLLEGLPDWQQTDKRAFQDYLANSIYPFAEAACYRANNWGSGGACAVSYIADYLWDRPEMLLLGLDGIGRNPAQAYEYGIHNQIARMNGSSKFDGGEVCAFTGIRPDGGLPLELHRGSTGCDGRWLHKQDKSWTYSITYLESILLHAELLLRRGDRRIYDNIHPTGSGSLLKALMFILDNPNDPGKSVDWKASHKHALELAYRYYRDPRLAARLGIGTADRIIGTNCGQSLHFGTITHGFAIGEEPPAPPITLPPGASPEQPISP